jgi:hypothetical protein
MRLPSEVHTSRPWRIHEVAPDFRLEDVWALPTPGGRDDFELLVDDFASFDLDAEASGVVKWLWALRWKLGEVCGWDDPGDGIGTRVPTLRDRLPADLLEARRGPDSPTLPFTSVYLLEREWAAEIANKTMHGVLHLAWVEDGAGRYRGQMAVLVKPNGVFGKAYMAAIRPFRYLLVYPQLLRRIDQTWRRHSLTS